MVRQFDVTVIGRMRFGKPSVENRRYSERELERLRAYIKLLMENKDIAFQIKEVSAP